MSLFGEMCWQRNCFRPVLATRERGIQIVRPAEGAETTWRTWRHFRSLHTVGTMKDHLSFTLRIHFNKFFISMFAPSILDDLEGLIMLSLQHVYDFHIISTK